MKDQAAPFETGNSLHVLTLDVSPDGQRLVVGQQGDDVTELALGVWRLDSRQLETPLVQARYVMPTTARFSPDSRLIAFSDQNQDLVVHDLTTNRSDSESFRLPYTKWLSFAWNRNRLIAGGTRTQVWDADLGATIFTLPVDALSEGGAIEPPCCALSPDGERVAASGVEAGRIIIYDLAGGEIVSRIEGTMDSARSMAFDPSGRFLAAAAEFGGGGLWDAETGEALLPELINMRADYYWCVRFHPDGDHVGFGLWTGFVEVIRIADGEFAVTQDAPIHHGRVNDLAFTRDGRRMVTGADDGIVLVWELA
jgi:WD40 repeat protein